MCLFDPILEYTDYMNSTFIHELLFRQAYDKSYEPTAFINISIPLVIHIRSGIDTSAA